MKIDLMKLEKAQLTLEEALVLAYIDCTNKEIKWPGGLPDQESYVSLKEKGFLEFKPDGVKITVTGYQHFRTVTGQIPLKLKKDKKLFKFDDFWNTYPIHDGHGNWMRTRLLRADKARSLKQYNIAITNGIKHEDIMKALNWQIADCLKNSTTKNKLTFMKNSATWLFQKEYEVILESLDVDNNRDNVSWTEDVI